MLRFYHNPKVWDLHKGLKAQLEALDSSGIAYVIFDDPDILLPELSFNGRKIAGADNIRQFLIETIYIATKPIIV